MNRVSLTLFGFALSLLAPLTVHAQERAAIKMQAPTSGSVISAVDGLKKFPALGKYKTFDVSSADELVPFRDPRHEQTFMAPQSNGPRQILKLPSGTTLWGYVASSNQVSKSGIYSFTPSAPAVFSPLTTSLYSNSSPNGGGAIYDNKYHYVYLNSAYIEYGVVYAYYYVYDLTKDWTQKPTYKTLSEGQYTLIGVETAYDPASKRNYGEFYNSDVTTYYIGYVDYETMTSTKLADATQMYVAMGLGNDGFLYGIGEDGNLYKINKTNGQQTLVGATGLTLETQKGLVSQQSGEIDPATGTFYWAAIDKDNNSALYTVDLQTGKATKILDYGKTQIFDLQIAPTEADSNVPAAVKDFKVSFSGGSHDGVATFTMPTATVGGQNITGNISYTITANGATVSTGSAAPGSSVSADMLAVGKGDVSFKLKLTTDAGSSPEVAVSSWVGYGIPSSPANVSLTNEGNTVTLKWDSVTTTTNNAPLGTITYDVVRYPDEITVAHDLTATTFSQQLSSSQLTSYSYAVKAKNADQESVESRSNSALIGDAFDVPYFEDFDNEANFKLFTIVDNNNDGSTWSRNNGMSAAVYKYNSHNAADDWLITPPVKLLAGRKYVASFNASAYINSVAERVEAKLGQGTTNDAMVNGKQIVAPTVLNNDRYSYKVLKDTFEVAANGNYNFGIHAVSDANAFWLIADSISITALPLEVSPDSVTNLTATPDANGQTKVALSFTAPSKSIEGVALDKLTKIVISRDDKEIHTISNPAVGSAITWTDTEETGLSEGSHTYTVVAYDGDEFGRKSSVTAYVGYDSPTEPKNIKIHDLQTSVSVTWDSPTVGQHGGVINPADLKYPFYDIVWSSEYGAYVPQLIDTAGTTSKSISYKTDEGAQTMLQYALSASNSNGTSSLVATPGLIVGKPQVLPFKEHFPAGNVENNWWVDYSGNAGFGFSTAVSSDGDNGCVVYKPAKAGDFAEMNTYKITLSGAANPKAIVDYNAPAGTVVRFDVQNPDGTVETLGSTTVSADNAGEWKTLKVAIPAKYASQRYIIGEFAAVAAESGTPVYFDNIRIEDLRANDLSAKLIAPSSVKKGSDIDVQLKVTNNGDNDASSYSYTLYANDKVIAQDTITTGLASMESQTFEKKYNVSVFSSDKEVALKATVDYASDLNTADNTASSKVTVSQQDVPAVSNVQVEHQDGNQIKVTWTAPVIKSSSVTENFDGFTGWSYQFGDWKVVDGNGGLAGNLVSGGPRYLHQGEAVGFLIIDPTNYGGMDATTDVPQFVAHSGKQYAGAPYVNDGKKIIDSDNWLISPRLDGSEQTISFWALNAHAVNSDTGAQSDFPETFDVLYSTTGNDTLNFTKVGDTYTKKGGSWTQYSFSVPENAQFFAIHQNTSSTTSYLLGIDDVTYTTGSGKPVEYRIYRDGVLVGTANELSFITEEEGGEHTYSVTAVYSDGSESEPVSATVTAINSILFENGKPFDIYSINGYLVKKAAKNTDGLTPGVYIINNVKVIVK